MAYKTKTSEEKAKEIHDLTAGMEGRILEYFKSEENLKEYLDFMGKFYHYSVNNSILIDHQFPGAEAIGSFAFWKSKGFTVNKGEKGIKIMVPKVVTYFERNGEEVQLKHATKKEKEQIEKKQIPSYTRTFFDIGHVFDVSQTTATVKDLPAIFPNRWLEGSVENYLTMYQALSKVAETNGIKIVEPYQELGMAKGVSYTMLKEVALNPRNSELQNVKTLVHELTHAVLHTAESRHTYTAQEKEFQAEMIAYTVSRYFGLDTTDYSLPYLHHWTNGKELKDQQQLLKEVREKAHDFIQTMEGELVKERDRALTKELEKDPESEKTGPLHTLHVTSFSDRTDRETDEMAQLVIKNGVTGKEHVTSIWASDWEKGELQPYYVYLQMPAKLSVGDDDRHERPLTDSIEDRPLFQIIEKDETLEKAIDEYSNGIIEEFRFDIPRAKQLIDLQEIIVNDELADMLLKSERGVLEKGDLVNFGKLVQDYDLGLKKPLNGNLEPSFKDVLNHERILKEEWPYIKATFQSLQMEMDTPSKNKPLAKAQVAHEFVR